MVNSTDDKLGETRQMVQRYLVGLSETFTESTDFLRSI